MLQHIIKTIFKKHKLKAIFTKSKDNLVLASNIFNTSLPFWLHINYERETITTPFSETVFHLSDPEVFDQIEQLITEILKTCKKS